MSEEEADYVLCLIEMKVGKQYVHMCKPFLKYMAREFSNSIQICFITDTIAKIYTKDLNEYSEFLEFMLEKTHISYKPIDDYTT